MQQTWYDLLFAHWPVLPEKLRPLIPAALEIDTFDRQAWVAVTPFHMNLRARGIPGLRLHFPELNCRTYVSFRGKPGVFFFSLDAGSRLAVRGARTFYALPYFYSRMKVDRREKQITYSSRRAGSPAAFTARYQPESVVRRSQPGTLENWLTERYCLYTFTRQHIYRGEIHHIPWPLQSASCEVGENGIAAAAGIELPALAPILHFAESIDVLIWPLRRGD
jgi:uncharacterized protein YqjF (DUF2071 family)